jgi:chemotaxis protein histidine kinase CheA
MDSFDINTYKEIFIKSSNESLARLKALLAEKPQQAEEIHRLFHTLKGRSYFMGYEDLGHDCLWGEKALEVKVGVHSLLEINETEELLKLVDKIKQKIEAL